MKKRFIRLFMFAAVASSMGVLNSCKDYDEDRNTDIEFQIKDLKADLAAQKAALEAAIAAIKQCNCNFDDVNNAIAAALAQHIASNPHLTTADVTKIVNDAINAHHNAEEHLTADQVSAMIQSAIQTALATIKQCGCTLTEAQVQEIASSLIADAMTQHIANYPHISAAEIQNMINQAILGFVTTQQLEDALSAINTSISTNTNGISDLNTLVSALATKSELETAISTLTEMINNIKPGEDLTDIKNAISTLQTTVSTIQGDINTLNSQMVNVMADATNALNKATANETTIGTMQTTLTTLSQNVTALDGKIDTKVGELQNEIDALNEKVKDVATKQDVAATVAKAYELYNEALKYTDQALNMAVSSLEEADKQLASEISTLSSELSTLSQQVSTNTLAIGALSQKFDDIIKRAAGIELQGTENPLFGTFNLPFGIQSNLLIAYHGENTHGAFKFPNPSFIDDADAEVFKANQILMNEEGNAGKIYLTVNPSDVDFSGAQLCLENSQGKASLFKMGKLVKSDKVIKFGSETRADNGFYEATVTLDPADMEAARIGIDNLETATELIKNEKAIAAQIINSIKGNATNGLTSNIKDLSNIIQDVLQKLNLDALATKGSWTDQAGSHAITSKYGIAATSVRPLNFTSLDALSTYSSVPGTQLILNSANRVADVTGNLIKSAISGLNFNGVQINNITLKTNGTYVVDLGLLNPTITGTTNVPVNKTLTVFDTSNNPVGTVTINDTFTGTTTASATFTGQTVDLSATIQKVFDDANASLSNLNDVVNQINSMIAEIDNMEGTITAGINNYKSLMSTWMDKVTGISLHAIHKAARLTKPTMIVMSDRGTTLAGFRNHFPYCTGEITLIPTTYSLEYLVPVFKKVVTVNGVKQTIEADGTIKATNIKAGVNEIKYAALDFDGNEVDNVYYIHVVE